MAGATCPPRSDQCLAIPYAGVGSRKTPAAALREIEALGQALARRGYLLRSGAAPGADAAWERGAIAGGGQREIYLPWRGFEKHTSDLVLQRLPSFRQAMDIAARHHPIWYELSQGEQKLMGRDVLQVLGADCASPVKFLVCWAPQSTFDTAGRLVNVSGGTGQAVRLAAHLRIPTFNLAHPPHRERVLTLLSPAPC